MSAIVPYPDTDDDYEFEEDLGAPGRRRPPPLSPEERFTARLTRTHSRVMRTLWTREAVHMQLAGRPFRVQAGDMTGGCPNEIFIIMEDEAIGPGPVWNPSVAPTQRQLRLLSWTSKMNCPSFSLPAGGVSLGGSCPGAEGGLSMTEETKAGPSARTVLRITGKPVNVSNTICAHCYALAGRYQFSRNQAEEYLRLEWARQALRQTIGGHTSFFLTMLYAVQNADYRLGGGEGPEGDSLRPERHEGKFFRLHDSGDFFSKEYLREWKKVANACPDITFWAPSRAWASPNGNAWVKEINREQGNFIIRPSSYEIGDAPPVFGPDSGWAAGSTSIEKRDNQGMGPDEDGVDLEEMIASREGRREKRAKGGPDRRYDWDCRAYAGADEHACRAAVAPDGNVGCRACWLYPGRRVNYALKLSSADEEA